VPIQPIHERNGENVNIELFRFRWLGWKRFGCDFFVIQIGFALFGLATDMMVQANLGLDPWDVLHMALSYHLPITLGEASIGVAFLMILLDLLLKERIGWGTFANMIFIGVWIDALRPLVPAVPRVFLIQVVYLLLGTLFMGFGTAIYVGVDAGAGPRDSMMLALSRAGKTSLRVARTCLEISAVTLGWLLGGPAWLGTLIFAITIGPAVQLAFRLLKVCTITTSKDSC
jgi:uncharacterized membrane protein YczE